MKNFRIQFENANLITENYSQAGQDLFVLMCLNGKKNGKFLDLGCHHPTQGGNNTYLLEKDFNWNGLSYDINASMINEFSKYRQTQAYCQDCTQLNWQDILNFSVHFDYLSLDLEPAEVTYQCLKSIPFNQIEFSIITYEHDFYRFGNEYKDKAYNLLTELGYIRICENVKYNGNIFEDWFINPKFIDLNKLKDLNNYSNHEFSDVIYLNDVYSQYYKNCIDFRLKGKNQEALKYYELAKKDNDFYLKNKEKLDYEMTILNYYCFPNQKTEGLKFLINYLNQYSLHEANVWVNLKYYIQSLRSSSKLIKRLESPDITGYINSSPCKLIMKNGKEYINIRNVNYSIQKDNGQYFYYNTNTHMSWENTLKNPVHTINVCNNQILEEINLTPYAQIKNSTIKGIEDIRIFEKDNKIMFLATTKDFSTQNRICTGQYLPEKNQILIEKVFNSPENSNCEKNWVMLNENEIIYKWHPLTIYSFDTLQKIKEIKTPNFFKHFRGGSNIIQIEGFNYCVVHTVHYENPRKYLHLIVKLNQEGYPLAYSVPFDFEGERIEYCLSMNYLTNGNLEFHYSTWDSSSKSLEIPFEYFNDKFIEV